MLKHVLSFSFLFVLLACSTSSRSLYERAEKEAANQRGQLARYLYLQVIDRHTFKDELRFNALRGLAELSFDQLHDYRDGLKAAEMAANEFSGSSLLNEELHQLRMKSSFVARVHLQDPEKALDLLKPVIDSKNLDAAEWQEVGRVYLDLRSFDEAESAFGKSWELSMASKQCKLLQEVQLDMMQTFTLAKKCERSLEWGGVEFPQGCSPDLFSVRIEMGHCLEIRGEIDKAMELYQKMLAEKPENFRAHYLLENIKRRQKEKLSK